MGKDSFGIFEKIFSGDQSNQLQKDIEPNILGAIVKWRQPYTIYGHGGVN